MAGFVLLWAGASMAVDNYHAAADLAEQAQPLDPASEEKFDLSSLDPLDCPAIASRSQPRVRLLPADPPDEIHAVWRSFIPPSNSPPPRRV